MTNKERIKKSINSDFDKESNYNKIIKKIEKGENRKMKNNIWKWSLIPICLVFIVSGILFVNFKNNNVSNPDTSYVGKENDITLHINYLDKVGAKRFDADIKEISSNGINITWPEILKDGITIPKDLDKFNGYAIYTRKDKTSQYDILNCYVYSYFNNEIDKDIRIAFSDTNKPIRDYLFSEEGSKETTINDTKLKIYKYENIYFTEFNYKGYNFDIEANNIAEQELLELLSSIVK